MSNKFNMTFGETYKVLEDGYQEGYKQGKKDALASINDGRLQQKIVTPSKEIQVITADDGYYGLSDVIVSATPFNNDDIKEMLTDGANATPNDIKLGKTAYVSGKLITGTYEASGTIDITENGTYDVTDYDTANVNIESTLKKILDVTKDMQYMFYQKSIDITGYISYEDTSNVTNMYYAFRGNSGLKIIPPLDTRNVKNMHYAFADCTNLITVQYLDMRNVTSNEGIFSSCSKLTNLTVLNIKNFLQVGSNSSWGHLLTLESLIGLCQECINTGKSSKLIVGSKNITKLANVYVKLTGEAEEDETLPKLPMTQCESTDEGAMTITQYMAEKNWALA